MKQLTAILVALCLLVTLLAGCSSQKEEKEDANNTAQNATADTAEQATVSDVDANGNYQYETRVIWCENNGNRIYGEAYIPVSHSRTTFPLVIHAHGMGSNREAGAGYGKRYAEKGYAAYTFDFPGGSKQATDNKSDGDIMQMSAVTEASDLQAILNTALTWEFVDTDNVFLEGGSMGGLVATMVALDNTDKVKGMILHYPALYMPQGLTGYYGSPENVPETVSFSDDYELGSKFVTDLWGVDVISRLGDFPGNVTIIQGSEDELVGASSIEEASKLFPNAEFHLIEGAGHGFGGDNFETAVEYGLAYLDVNT